MQPDLSVIRRHGRYRVLAHSQPARLKDGTVIDIHLVQQDPPHLDDRFLRAVLDHELVQSHVFDVRDLAASRELRQGLDDDMRRAHERDAGDLVVLTLRQFYPDAASLLTKIVEESLAKLLPASHFIHGANSQADMFLPAQATPAELTALQQFIAQPPAVRRPLYGRGKEAGHV